MQLETVITFEPSVSIGLPITYRIVPLTCTTYMALFLEVTHFPSEGENYNFDTTVVIPEAT